MQDNPLILVAEDDADIRTIIVTHLQDAGYQVRAAKTGVEAMVSMTAEWPQALILDINMPDLDGFGVLEAIPSVQMGRLPTMVLTGRHEAHDLQRALRLGAWTI